MKQLHLALFTVLFSLFTQAVFGQTNKPCNNFDCAYKKAETFLKQAAYQKALDNLDSAEGYLTDTNTKEKEQIKQLRRRLFVAIEKEKEEAKRARDEAKRQTEIANEEKAKAQAAERKVRKVLDKIYFYDGKFGLAYDGNSYGFIDKELNPKSDFAYKEALPFDNTGYTKVVNGNIAYLIDTFNVKYKLATDINHLNTFTKALDLRDNYDSTLPSLIFRHKQLEVLLLNKNRISHLSDSISELTNLQTEVYPKGWTVGERFVN